MQYNYGNKIIVSYPYFWTLKNNWHMYIVLLIISNINFSCIMILLITCATFSEIDAYGHEKVCAVSFFSSVSDLKFTCK